MVTKQDKAEWHREMKPVAYDIRDGLCMHCSHKFPIEDSVIHHTAYPSGVYSLHISELFDNGLCEWLCNECHQKAHIAVSYEETKKGVKNAGYCHSCNNLSFGGWERGHGMKENFCICRACFNKNKDEENGIYSLL